MHSSCIIKSLIIKKFFHIINNPTALVGYLNIFFSVLSFLSLVGILWSFLKAEELDLSVPLAPYIIVPTIIFAISLYLGTEMLWKKKVSRLLFIIGTVFPMLLVLALPLLLSELGMFSERIFLIDIVLGMILPISFWKNNMKRAASLILFIIIGSNILAWAYSFEEDYCWDKGIVTAPEGYEMVEIPSEEAKKYGIDETEKETVQIGVGWKAHMDCHTNFNFTNALKDKYRF